MRGPDGLKWQNFFGATRLKLKGYTEACVALPLPFSLSYHLGLGQGCGMGQGEVQTPNAK